VCPRRRDRGPGDASGRRSSGGFARTPRSSFFSTPSQAQHPSFGIAKHAANGLLRLEAGEPICVIQTPLVIHSRIMASFVAEENRKKPGKTASEVGSRVTFYPLTLEKSQDSF
jgi:hypothetical protein